MVEDLGAGPALVNRVAEGPVLAHAPPVTPAPAVDHDRAIVRGGHRTRDRGAGTRDDQLLTHRQHVGVGQPVGLHDRRNGHVVTAGDQREALTGLHRDDQRSSCSRRRHETRNGQSLPHVDQVGVGDAVLGHQVGHRHRVAAGDQREALTGLDCDDRRPER